MRKFALALSVVALMASVSQACPLFGRRSCSATKTVTVTYACGGQKVERILDKNPDIVPVEHKAAPEAKPAPINAQAPSCANGQCQPQATRSFGLFRLFR